MEVFRQYKDVISRALHNNSVDDTLMKAQDYQYISAQRSRYTIQDFNKQKNILELSSGLKDIAAKMGAVPFPNQTIGLHPDFAHLKGTDETEFHYIISAFIDIKGSTNLFKKYDPITVSIITKTIQLAAINVCTMFGGFIQRLQGDGIFVYFGGKNRNREQTVQHALTALSFFTYFVKNDIKELFEEQGIEKINAKIGVDFGDDKDVLWGMAGLDEMSEITTFSLHTSLASKMQAYARSNEIIIGQNIVDRASLDYNLIEAVGDKRYIYEIQEKGFRYTQYNFNWLKFLKSLSYIATDLNGSISIKSVPTHTPIDMMPLKMVAQESKPWCKNGY